MAYNLQPLITILEGILDPDQSRWIVAENNPQLQSLLDKATSLQQLLDKSSVTKLDSQIREVAHQAEDIIESHMVHHQMLSGSDCVRFTISTPNLQQVTRDLDSVTEQLEKLVEMEDTKMPQEHDSAVDQVLKPVEVDDKKMVARSSSSVVVIFSNPRRVRFDTSKGMDSVKGSTEYMSLTRSVIGIGFGRNELPSGVFSASKLLRVLDVMGMEFAEFPTEIFESVNLRFLGVKCHSRIPKGISRLWNLQTLIGYCRFDAPCELWQLSELRNLKVYGFELLKNEEMNYCVMKKLQMISDTKITKEASTWDGFFKSIPNVKKLAINDEFRSASKAIDLSDLHKLEILRCSYMITSSNCRSQVIFPCKIRKLVLFKCVINSRVLSSLCALHNLEVLRIRGCKFESEVGTCDAEWEAADEDEFRSLQFLYLEWLPLDIGGLFRCLCNPAFDIDDNEIVDLKKMAYNLQPLITILEGILDPHQPRWIVDENNPQLQSLFDKATCLQKLLDSKSSFTKLDTQIREVVHEAEDIIESHMVHHMLSGSDCVRFTLSTPDLQQVTRHLDSLMEQAEKLLEKGDEKMLRELDSAMEQLKLVDKKMPSSSSYSSKSAVLVGIDEDLMQLKDRLIDKCMNGPNKFTFSNLRRMIFHTSVEMEDVNDSADSMTLTRSVICIGFHRAGFPSGALFAARLLRVLDLRDRPFSTFPAEIFEFVNLRLLRVRGYFSMPRGISRLWNLQTLIAPHCKFDEPAELWKLSELRHLKVDEIELLKDEAMNYSVLKKLQSIVSVKVPKDEATSLDGFLKSVPNIKKLLIDDSLRTTSTAIDLSHLHKLEILKFWFMRTISSPNGFGHCLTVIFPCNIRKVVLMACEMILGAWRTLCALHKLEVLIIYNCSFNETGYDEEWELADRDVFPSLQFLHLELLRIVHRKIRRCLEENWGQCYSSNFTIPRGISRLRNLQTLIAPVCHLDVPSELWQLSELRKVKVYGLELLKDEEMKYSVMKKLQRISLTKLTEEESSWDDFFKSIPNVKRLLIDDELRRKAQTLYLRHLDKLEILICKCFSAVDSPDGSHCRFLVKFPGHIRKLVLDACVLTSRVSRTLCALHKLEELTIEACLFLSEMRSKEEVEWEVEDGEVFSSLQFLSLGSLFFVRWIADETNFPRLRHLYVKDSLQLEEIPSSIGDVPTLQLIDLQDCTESVVASAERIVEEQSDYGNDIKLCISETPNRQRPHFQKVTNHLCNLNILNAQQQHSDASTAQPEEGDDDSENEDLSASKSTAPPWRL
ncbi:hypothetical protein SASPL_113141 [Salvia splendens]|uniref:Disease resistance R13L4/SHOC-2-like LRR domain-containing protein n=1 Tax=Salvia splendens TaxID=180675 RepID=A0A8X8XYE5_SALSN|nr:hypothetical protein SASPL_113141 [Salvia splendens]